MDAAEKFNLFRNNVGAGIERWVPSATTQPAVLHEAMRYSLQAGGKRLRPVLVLAASELLPGAPDPMPAAVAVECLHTYSLIHDDLPCMDNSRLRRGRETCHIRFGEANALLAGDALLTHAFYLLGSGYRAHPEIAAALTETLGKAAGSRHLIGGQVLDLLAEAEAPSASELETIHRNKTASLLAACLCMGGHLCRAPEDSLAALERAGLAMGHAFQIIDDILDATSDAATLGKDSGADARNEKLTYVSLHGIAAAHAEADRRTQEAQEQLRSLDADTTFLLWLLGEMQHRLA